MDIREIQLPGIGMKYQVDTQSGERMVIIIHDDGRRDIYHFEKDDLEESKAMVELSDSEARQLAAIIGGMTYKPTALENIEMAFDDLVIEWHKVSESANCINKSIGELDIRQNFDMIIIAILRKNQCKIINPGPETIIESGDTLVVSGQRDHLKEIKRKLFIGSDG
ncbi:cation:proton antiporter regulatory subunit [Paenibacillus sp. 481]|uniref:cation:proton antiporter regulatory subunit n=1 Tax=Paenibacillus sp. 481 TaxID=2835869 RepID=UPI001E3CE751|nr:cation:proton antiporter regulatory subunit [Paenibacillus sp. 481]UHA72372.1 cation:proton antiporter regulatory subunit [Paenibacillus sp. 481]